MALLKPRPGFEAAVALMWVAASAATLMDNRSVGDKEAF